MKSAPPRQSWYRVALATTPPRQVAVEGEHVGAAVATAEKHLGARAFAVDGADADVIPLGESVGKQRVVDLGASPDPAGFAWPHGVLPQIGHAVAGARRGWIEHADHRLFVIEALTDRDHLVDLFLGMVERLPVADNLEVRVMPHFTTPEVNAASSRSDVWLTSRVDAKKILAFLDDFEDDLIANGHVELSVYLRKHEATLRLTEHKTVVWLASGRAMAGEVERWLGELDVPRVDPLPRMSDVPHFHYRPLGTRDRKKLGDLLFRQRLRRVDTARAALGPRETDG